MVPPSHGIWALAEFASGVAGLVLPKKRSPARPAAAGTVFILVTFGTADRDVI
jgi:hypothetical protein